MPAPEADLQGPPEPLRRLPFPPLLKSHILHCSIHFWYPLYRSLTPKTRLIPLSAPFLDYLRADGIVLPPSPHTQGCPPSPPSSASDRDSDSGFEHDFNPSVQWLAIHTAVASTIKELGGAVHPKLNWSAPKDATWIAATNSMECREPNDVYLLLKSSDFISHDLEHAFDECIEDAANTTIPYTLALRKSIPSPVPAVEFRCFVRSRTLLGITQRDLNHYDFLSSLRPLLRSLIQGFFEDKLKASFPDESFVFDVYVPQPKERGKVWLVDINPWAARTDPLLFSWLELLTMEGPETTVGPDSEIEGNIAGLSLNGNPALVSTMDDSGESDTEDGGHVSRFPLFRLVGRDDPEAYNFNTPQFSAHKLPKDVVDASMDGQGGLREFLAQWRDVVGGHDEVSSDGESKDLGELDRLEPTKP